jgi:hypothetical protein
MAFCTLEKCVVKLKSNPKPFVNPLLETKLNDSSRYRPSKELAMEKVANAIAGTRIRILFCTFLIYASDLECSFTKSLSAICTSAEAWITSGIKLSATPKMNCVPVAR